MAPVKRRPHARSHHRMKLRRRKPNIPELVYKFLRIAEDGGRESASHSCSGTCRLSRQRKHHEELENSADSRRAGGKSMANKQRKDRTRNPKSRGVKRHRTSKDQALSSCMHRCHGEDGLRKVKRYIQKALDFGVESGYLIPRDSTFKVLRVSSDLMGRRLDRAKVRAGERTISQERGRSPCRTPTRFEDYQVQDAKRRRRRRRRGRRRSRSGSKRGRRRSSRRGRKRSRSQNPEEAAENDEDYEDELDNNEEKRNNRAEDADRDPENARLNPPDGEKTVVKRDDDGSELSVDEDETDDEEERKREDTTKS